MDLHLPHFIFQDTLDDKSELWNPRKLLEINNGLSKSIFIMATREIRHLIEDLEDETWQALKRSGADMVPYLTKDCVMQFPLGMKLTRDTVPSVQDILHSPAFVPWKSYRMSKVDVTPVGRDGAVISYLIEATRLAAEPEDDDVKFEALCCSVWRMNEDGVFKMCLHQQTMTT